MVLSLLRKLFGRMFGSRTGGLSGAPRRPRFRPCLRSLEDRAVPATISWLRPVSGDFSNPADWAGGVVPTAADVAVIPFANITVTHNTSAADSVSRIISEAAIRLSAGSLTVGDPTLSTATSSRIDQLFSVAGSGTLTLDDLTLTGTGSLTNSATLNISALSNVDVGVRNNAGVLTDSGTIRNTAALPFVNRPNATLAATNATFTNGFTNQGLIQVGNGGFGGSLNISNGTLVNAPGGTIDLVFPGSRRSDSLSANVDNQGAINFQGNSTIGGSGHTVTNSGTITANFGTLDSVAASAFTNTGTLDITANAFGGLTVSGGTFNQNGTVTGPGRLTLFGTTANFTGNVSNAGTGLAILNSTFNTTGTLTNVGTLDISGSTINAPLVNQGTLTADAANTAINGAFTNPAGATLVVEGPFGTAGNLTIAQGFTNQGTIQLTNPPTSGLADATLTVANGTLTNAPGATISTVAGTSGGKRFLNAQLVNQGTFTVGEETTLTGALTNSGTLNLASGDLTVNLTGTTPQLVNTGTVTVASLESLGVGGGDFANSGTVSLGSFGSVQVTGNYTQTAGSTLLGGGILTVGGLVDVEGGTLTGPGTINGNVRNAATVDVSTPGSPGVLTVVGNYTQTSTGDLTVQIGGSTAGTTFDQLDVTGQATLAGPLTVRLINGFVPTHGAAFTILTDGSRSGVFATLNGDGSAFTPHYNPSNVTLVAN